MKDAKGHGSDPRASHKLVADYRAAHQLGISAAVPSSSDATAKAAKIAAIAMKLYIAQAAAGAAVGGALPWLRLAGIL